MTLRWSKIGRAALCGFAVLTPAQAAAASGPDGALDVDLVRPSGALLGELHGDVDGRHGLGTFRAAAGVRVPSEVVGLRARRTRDGRGWRIRARAHELRLVLRMDPDGSLHGRGHAARRPVRATGVGGERPPRLRKGMRMLVVGHPHGRSRCWRTSPSTSRTRPARTSCAWMQCDASGRNIGYADGPLITLPASAIAAGENITCWAWMK